MTTIADPPVKRRLTRRGIQRRRELLESALQLFSEQGYDGATTKAIAERSGVTEAVIFRYFPTKSDLFREVVDEYTPPLNYPMPYEALRKKPFDDALGDLIAGYLDNSWAHRRSMRLFLLATFHDPDVLEELGKLFDFRRRRLHEMIEERVATGEVRADAKEYAAEMITLSVTGFMVRSLRREPANWPRSRDQFVRNLVSLVNGGVVSKG